MGLQDYDRDRRKEARNQLRQKYVDSLFQLQNQAAPPTERGDLLARLTKVVDRELQGSGLPQDQTREVARRLFLSYLEQWDQSED